MCMHNVCCLLIFVHYQFCSLRQQGFVGSENSLNTVYIEPKEHREGNTSSREGSCLLKNKGALKGNVCGN